MSDQVPGVNEAVDAIMDAQTPAAFSAACTSLYALGPSNGLRLALNFVNHECGRARRLELAARAYVASQIALREAHDPGKVEGLVHQVAVDFQSLLAALHDDRPPG